MRREINRVSHVRDKAVSEINGIARKFYMLQLCEREVVGDSNSDIKSSTIRRAVS